MSQSHSNYEVLQALCRQDFGAFTHKAFSLIEPGTPFQPTWGTDCIAEHLQAQFNGDAELQRLIINEPPRCLKSVQTAQIYPAWGMGKDPSHQFIGASYAHSLSERNVMKCRQVMQDEFYLDTFRNTRISADQNQKDYFTTTMAGAYKGTGIGGTITGFGCKTLIIDDPINPKEAMSDTIRVTAINEIRSTLFSRFNKYSEGRLVLIMQRLHEADPTGELLADGGYYHLKLPAENKSDKTIYIGAPGLTKHKMEPGELLTPRLTRDDLDKLRAGMTEYHYVGQYLQEPVPIGGGEFREEWLNYYPVGSIKPREMNIVILCDPSGGEDTNKKRKKLSDWSTFLVIGLGPDNNYYWLDGIRDRLNPTDRVKTLMMLHRKWNGLTGKPPKVGYEKYGMMTDTHYIRDSMVRESYNFGLVELGGAMAKEERIRRLIPDMQTGRWWFPHRMDYMDQEGRAFDLVKEIKDGEMKSFPRSRYDDLLDAMSRVYEAELFLTFPKPKANMVDKAMRPARVESSWMDF